MDWLTYFIEYVEKLPKLTQEEQNDLLEKFYRYKTAVKAEKSTTNKWKEETRIKKERLNEIISEGKCAEKLLRKANIRLVVGTVFKYYPKQSDKLELIQEGTLGLFKAIETYIPDKGAKFSTWAIVCIRNSINMKIFNDGKNLCSYNSYKLKRQITKKKWELRANSIEPTPKVIAQHLNLSEETIQRILLDKKTIVSLDQTELKEAYDSLAVQFKESVEGIFNSTVEYEKLCKELNKYMDVNLTRLEKTIIQELFGFNGKPKAMSRIGKEQRISLERVRQAKARAIRKLKENRKSLMISQEL